MLTIEEYQLGFQTLHLLSKLCLIPIRVDMKLGRIQQEWKKGRKYGWLLILALACTHTLYIGYRLAESLLFPHYFKEQNFSIHLAHTVYATTCCFLAYQIFIKNPDANVIVFNEIFFTREDSGVDERTFEIEESKVRKSNRRHWTQLSRQEILVISIPFMSMGMAGAATTIYTTDQERRQLIYASLPDVFQTMAPFWLLIPVDGFALLFSATSASMVLVAQLLFFLKCESQCQTITAGLRAVAEQTKDTMSRVPYEPILEALKRTGEMVTAIRIFNVVHSQSIFYYKLYSLANSILLIFFAIKNFGVNPIPSGIDAFIGFQVATLFSILYEKAFMIPGMLKELKDEILVISRGLPDGTRIKYVKLFDLAIPSVGIKVGTFHTLERISTPNFVSYCLQQISTLLITFK